MSAEPRRPRRFRAEGPRTGERRRAQLLDVAEQALADTSGSDLTIEQIASTASVSRSSVYFYFQNKSEIVDALISRASEEMLTRMTPRHDAESPGDFVDRIVSAALRGWQEHTPVFLAAVELASRANEGAAAWQDTMAVFADRLATGAPDRESDARAALARAEVACWTVERNLYMLFARNHTSREEDQLAQTLRRALLAVLDTH